MSLFSGTPVDSSGTSTSAMPQWYQEMLYNNLNWANSLAQKPYEQFSGPRVAPLSAQEQQAYDMTSQNVGKWSGDIGGAAAGAAALGANPTASLTNIQSYMNPYTANVTDAIAKLGARNLSENLLPAVSDQFIKAGQFGGSRMGEFGARALRDTQESVLNQQAQALQSGYGQALTASGADRERQLTALQQAGQLAQAGQASNTAELAALEGTGAARRNAQQRNIDANVADFEAQKNYPYGLSDWYMGQLQGTSKGLPTTTTQTSTSNTGPSVLSQIATGMFGGAGLWKTLTQP